MKRACALATLLTIFCCMPAAAQRVLFDARHGQTAGNADWIVDADTSEQYWDTFRCQRGGQHHSAQRLPTPPQSQIALDTPETFWDGGISAWAVDLVKDALDPQRQRDWQIEQYPWNAPPFTYGDATNPQDLSQYDVLVLDEPNVLFTASEAEAIREFVRKGGGLFLIADHETSDRNCSGGPAEKHDSPFILNRLMQTAVATSRTAPFFDSTDPNHDYGVFGIWFYENDNDSQSDSQNKRFDWFTEPMNNNVSTAADDPIIHGPFGDGSAGLGLFASTQMAVSTHPDKGNPTARPHIWRNGQSHAQNAMGVWERVTMVSARYGEGRVVAVGDSSPTDDGTGEGRLHDGWDKATGVANDILFLNATEWLAQAKPQPDTAPPTIVAGPAVAVGACRATVHWVTDKAAPSELQWGASAALGQHVSQAEFTNDHTLELAGLTPQTTYFYRVSSDDAEGRGPTPSMLGTFTTPGSAPVSFTAAPSGSEPTATSVTIVWETTTLTSGALRYRAEGEPERLLPIAGMARQHTVVLSGLMASTEYRYQVEVTDSCGEKAVSSESRFTTPARPSSRDISGWKLSNSNASFQFTFPPGTVVPAGGYVVVGRDSDREAFESEWGALESAVLYLNSHNTIIINATPRSYTLLDGQGNVVDGATVEIRASRSKHRLNGCAPSGAVSAWGDRGKSAGDPGHGAPPACGGGLILTEMTDGRNFRNEFIEMFLDANTR